VACDEEKRRVLTTADECEDRRRRIEQKKLLCERHPVLSPDECLDSNEFGSPPLSQQETELEDCEDRLEAAIEARAACLRTAAERQDFTGRVTFIDVREVGEGFGPLDDRLDNVQVAFRLDTTGAMHHAFSLRNDAVPPDPSDPDPVGGRQALAHQAYLGLVRDSFERNRPIAITITQRFKQNGDPRLNNEVAGIRASR
jgi:hypothetical protein